MRNNEYGKRKRGGQPGNTNAKRHGFYTKGGKKDWEAMDKIIMECKELLSRINETINNDYKAA
jgi:hypothetical protein